MAKRSKPDDKINQNPPEEIEPQGAVETATEELAETQPKNISDVVEKAIDSIPDVSEGMEEINPYAGYDTDGNQLIPTATATATQSSSGSVDIFDPTIHATNADGSPRKTVDGKFALKRGRKTGGMGTSSPVPVVSSDIASRRATAVTMVSLLTTTGVTIFGSEWIPVKDEKAGVDERENLVVAFDRYFEATGTLDLPPSLVLVVAVGAYAIPRFTMPETKKRVANIVKYVKEKNSGKPIETVDEFPGVN